MKKCMSIVFVLFMLLSANSAFATIYYVNDLTGNNTYNGLFPTHTTGLNGPLNTIMAAVNIISAGDTIMISPGLYYENVIVDSQLVIIGAGSGMDTTANTVIQSSVSSTGTGITLNTGGISSAIRTIIKDLRVQNFQFGITFASYTTYYNVTSNLSSSYGFYLNSGSITDIEQIKCNATNNIQGGIYIGHSAGVDGWLLDSCSLTGNNFSGLYIFCNNPSTATVSNFVFKNSEIIKNFQKGMYIEKLENALFENLIVDSCGYNPSYNYNAGIDINLKYNDYKNITFKFCDITNCGLGGSNAFGCGLIVKGRDDGSTYGANPATLDSVLIEGLKIKNCLKGLIVGEPNASNLTPTNLDIRLSYLANNNLYDVVSEIQANVTAHNNWWGSLNGPDTGNIFLNSTGLVKSVTYLNIGTDLTPNEPGFYTSSRVIFNPLIHSLHDAINTTPYLFILVVPNFTYTGLTSVTNTIAMYPDTNVIIDSLIIEPYGAISVLLDGFEIQKYLELKDSSSLNMNSPQIVELSSDANIVEYPGIVVKGKLQTERAILSSGTTENFGGLGLEITSGSSTQPENTTLIRSTSSMSLISNNQIPRTFNINAQNNSGLDATLKYYYYDSETDSIGSESCLVLFRSIDGGNIWTMEGGFIDTLNNCLTISGLDSINGLWSAFDSTGYASIDETNQETNIKLYPNPSINGNFTMEFNGPTQIDIYNQIGQKIYSENISLSGQIIKRFNLSDIEKGILLITITMNDGKRITKKLVVY